MKFRLRDSRSVIQLYFQRRRAEVERVESEASDCEIVDVFATPHREGIRARKRKLKIALFKIEATD
jgi:hypothetical protein